MVAPRDKQIVAAMINEYEVRRDNYHFYNWELAELERCEKEIISVIMSYKDSIPDIVELGREFPKIERLIPEDIMKQVKQYVNAQQKPSNMFYSFDGQGFATLEEAILRNEECLQNLHVVSNSR